MTADFDGQRIDLAAEADFRLGELRVRPSTRQLERDGLAETLEPRIMQVLVALARKQGHVVSRDDLIHICWDGRIVGDDALNRCVAKIRRLGEAHGDFHLETIPRVGYRLRVEAPKPLPGNDAGAEAPRPEVRRRSVVLPLLLTVALLAAVGIGIAYWAIRNSRTLNVSLPTAIAVMKFDAPADDSALQQFASAASQAVADGLTRAGQRVVPADLVRNPEVRSDTSEPGSGGQLLVNGYVSHEGDRVRVVARLDHARQHFTVWSNTLEGALGEPGLVGQRLSAQIMTKLNLSGPAKLLNSSDPRDIDRARSWLLVLQRSDDGDDRGAMEGTKRLIDIWPDAVHPYYMRAIETMDALPSLSPADRAAEFKAARAAALRAFELDKQQPQESTGPFSALARTTPAYAWKERITGLEDAIATGRTVPPTGWLADNYLSVGRSSDAMDRIGGDGLIPAKTPLVTRARIFLALGDKTRAERDLNDGNELWPLHPVFRLLMLEASAWLGTPDQAALHLANAPGSLSDAQRALISRFIDARRSGKAADIAAVESQCTLPSARREEATLLYCLSALTVLGRQDAAFGIAGLLFPEIRPQAGEDPDARWLAAPASAWEPSVLYMPWMAPMRADPRIVPLFEHLGLLDYWRTTGEWPDFCDSEPASVCRVMKAG